MWMQIATRLAVFCGIAACFAYGIDRYGFAFVHSPGWVYLIFFMSPGCVLIFFHGNLDPVASWSLFIFANVLYYEMIYRLLLWLKKNSRK